MTESSPAPQSQAENPAPKRRKVNSTFRKTAARVAAAQVLYTHDMTGQYQAVLGDALKNRYEISIGEGKVVRTEPDEKLVSAIIEAVLAMPAELDAKLEPCLGEGWTVERLSPLIRSILRAGAYEMVVAKAAPPKVIINEYVTVAHAFFSDVETAFINASLDRLGKNEGLLGGAAASDSPPAQAD